MADNASKTDSALIAEMLAEMRALREKVDTLEQEKADAEFRPEPVEYAKKPWAEEIWAEALRDCTYPNPNDTYGIYRKGRMNENHGEVFRIAHREHLANHLREISKDELAKLSQQTIAALPQVPQTNARGQKSRPGHY